MPSLKQLQLSQKSAVRQQQAIAELDAIVKSIERCEKTIIELKAELEATNLKHQDRKTTQEDVNYLTDLLKCAHKKLAWEKQLAALQKRTPPLLEKVSSLMNDPQCPPTEEMRSGTSRALQSLQAAMERLHAAKIT